MYPFLSFFLIILILFSCTHFYRHKKIVKKIKCLSDEKKCEKLNALIEPFGYSYNRCQDVFSNTLHPWQRQFGYGTVYDRMAPHFQMIFNRHPIYFNYKEETWLIEFWKGQYGINTGGEIGIYKADEIIPAKKREFEIFHAISDKELLFLSLKLNYKGNLIACFSKPHWWLTAFKMGCFSHPKELSMDISITFPDYTMLNAFLDGAAQSEFPPDTIHINGLTAYLTFDSCSSCTYGFFKRTYIRYVQRKNKCFCKLFLLITKDFTLSMDRILYLYEYAPFAFRKMFTIHNYNISKSKGTY